MKPYFEENGITIYHGNALSVLRELPADSVQTCITSPPYWGLRDYGTETWQGGDPECSHSNRHGMQGATGERNDRQFTGAQNFYRRECGKCGAIREDEQIGLELNYLDFIGRITEVFSEVRRVLRSDGTLWLNLGDSYATGAGSPGNSPGGGEQGSKWAGQHPGRMKQNGLATNSGAAIGPMIQPNRMPQTGLKSKDLVGIPWRVAFALQAEGWYLRSDIIWHKPNPMPESVKDRPTKSHEYIFLLAKSEKYFYDAAAIAEPVTGGAHSRGDASPNAPKSSNSPNGFIRDRHKYQTSGKHAETDEQAPGRRMAENVAKARADGGAHDSPFGETRNRRTVWTIKTAPFPAAHFATFPEALVMPCILAGARRGDVVLDPFSGAATVGLVARRNGNPYIGIELNAEYCEIAKRRLQQQVLEF